MNGELLPLVMIPRFTSYVGEGTYTTVPLEISEFEGAAIEFWRGHLAGKAQGATFAAYLEEAFEASPPTLADWTTLASTTADNASNLYQVAFSQRYFRIRIVLVKDATNGLAAITCWAAGTLERRIPPGAAPE